MNRQTKPRRRTTRARKASNDTVPTLTPEQLFARLLAPKPATPKATVEDIGQSNWYVVVDGKAMSRYECKEDAEHCALNW
jgi:hypothetical protein